MIDLDSINNGDVIICGGVGEDISFEEELLKYKDITIIEIDPGYCTWILENQPTGVIAKQIIRHFNR